MYFAEYRRRGHTEGPLNTGLTEGAFEKVIASLGHVHVETRVAVLEHDLVPPLLRSGPVPGFHLLRRLRRYKAPLQVITRHYTSFIKKVMTGVRENKTKKAHLVFNHVMRQEPREPTRHF